MSKANVLAYALPALLSGASIIGQIWWFQYRELPVHQGSAPSELGHLTWCGMWVFLFLTNWFWSAYENFEDVRDPSWGELLIFFATAAFIAMSAVHGGSFAPAPTGAMKLLSWIVIPISVGSAMFAGYALGLATQCFCRMGAERWGQVCDFCPGGDNAITVAGFK